ncbi:MAG: hypothetical protein EA361_00520 [Bacteroidetes bacterium]|nr:MAG: hypothetical protein EA361_00520 [Bacteroidota bacterium]
MLSEHQPGKGPSLFKWMLFVAVFILFYSCGPSSPMDSHSTDLFLDNFSYSGKYLDISNETENARATHWKPDGSIVFITGRYSNNVAAYILEEPWEISTATFLHDVVVPGEFQHGLFIKPDGNRMWVFDRTSIWEMDLVTPWNITTISESRNIYVGDFVERGHDIDFTPGGDTLFIDDRNTGAVFAMQLSSPWEVATGKLVQTLDISHEQKEVRGIEFVKNGTLMILMDTERAEMLEYHLTEPYNILTAKLANTFDVSPQTLQGRGLSFNADLTSFYVTGRDEEKIFQYDLTPVKK